MLCTTPPADALNAAPAPSETKARQAVMAICAEATTAELAEVVAACGYAGAIRELRRPESGLVMVRGRIGGDGDAFNLGEMIITRCVVQLDGGEEGYAFTPGRDRDRARKAAEIDALLQSPAHAGAVQMAVQPVKARIAADLAQTEARIAATRVNFFTMTRGED